MSVRIGCRVCAVSGAVSVLCLYLCCVCAVLYFLPMSLRVGCFVCAVSVLCLCCVCAVSVLYFVPMFIGR